MRLTKLVRFLPIILTIFYLQGCSQAEHTKLPDDAVILAFGDSLTAGYGVSKQQDYPAVLAELTQRKVINAGVSGEKTADGLPRLQKLLQNTEQRIDLVVLLEGGNDILQNKPYSQTKSNLAAMIELLQAKNIQILLVGVPEKKLFSDSAPFYKELADEYNLPLENDIVSDIMVRASLKSDYVHFNQQGYRVLAEAIQQKLVDSGALQD
ncbi:acyl-CoA thioesterase I [uncultured Thiomicrorhabdus sp.]